MKNGFASKHGLEVGKPFTFTGPDGRRTRLVPRAVYAESKFDSMLGSVIVSNATFDRVLPRPHDQYAFVNVAWTRLTTARRRRRWNRTTTTSSSVRQGSRRS